MNIDEIIKIAVEKTDIVEATNSILGSDIKPGAEVAIIDDPTYSQAGVKAKVRGVSAKGSGFLDVELPNGVVLAVQSSLLLSV